MQVDLNSLFVKGHYFIIHIDDPAVIGRKRNIERNNMQSFTQTSKDADFLFEIKTIGVDAGFKMRPFFSLLIININI